MTFNHLAILDSEQKLYNEMWRYELYISVKFKYDILHAQCF